MKLTFREVDVELRIEGGKGPSYGPRMRGPRLAVRWFRREEAEHAALMTELLDATEAETLARALLGLVRDMQKGTP